MNAPNRDIRKRMYVPAVIACPSLIAVVAAFWDGGSLGARNGTRSGTPGVPYVTQWRMSSNWNAEMSVTAGVDITGAPNRGRRASPNQTERLFGLGMAPTRNRK
jgi:hypothetical protein